MLVNVVGRDRKHLPTVLGLHLIRREHISAMFTSDI